MQNFVQNNNYGLLIDLDGTIIQKNEIITNEVEKSIKKLNQYIPIAIVTGRGPQDVLKFSNFEPTEFTHKLHNFRQDLGR